MTNSLVIGLGTLIGSSIIADIFERKMQKYDEEVEPPIDTVSIILPTYNEEQFIERCLQSLTNQSIVDAYPEYFEFILIDSGSKDRTLELSMQYLNILCNKLTQERVKLITTDKRGKLTARNMATDMSTGNIIVSVDADTIYPYHYLNTLLKPFKDPEVVGVDGGELDYSIPNISGKLMSFLYLLRKTFIWPNRMHGRHCAYMKHIFYKMGKFDESINQMDVKQMIKEEEKEFGNRMSKLGKVIFKYNACCFHLGGERVACRVGTIKNKDICKGYGISIERFDSTK